MSCGGNYRVQAITERTDSRKSKGGVKTSGLLKASRGWSLKTRLQMKDWFQFKSAMATDNEFWKTVLRVYCC